MAQAGTTRTRTALLAVLTMAALLLAACSSSDSGSGDDGGSGGDGDQSQAQAVNQLEPEDTPTDGGKLTVGLTAETNGWNPGVAQWADAGEMAGPSMLETLLVLNPDTTFDPWLAESVEPTNPDDYTSWTIKVRPGVTFHNGEPLDAEVVARNINFYAHEAPLSSLAMNDKVDNAFAVDDMTVQVDLLVPWAAYRTVLAGGSGFIMANEMLDAPDKGASNPIGTGPYRFRSWEQDKALNVSKYEDYWQEGKPHVEEIEFRPIVDSKQRVEALKAGDVDMIMSTRAADVAELKQDYTVVVDWGSERTIVMLNTAESGDPANPNPFTNIHARKALAYSIDRQALIDTFGAGEDIVSATSPFTGAWVMDDAQSGYVGYDPDEARKELELYLEDSGAPELTFTFSGLANLEDQQIMQFLKQEWEELGVVANIETTEQTAYIGQVVGGNFQAAYFRNYGYLDPDSEYYFWSCETANGVGNISINFTQYCDDITEEGITTGRTDPDFETRREAYYRMAVARNEAATDLWLFNTPYSIITEPEVRGLNSLRQRPFGNFEPKPWLWIDVWLDR